MKKIRQTNFYTIIASDYPKMWEHRRCTLNYGILGRYKASASDHRGCNGINPTLLCLLTQPVGMVSKSTTAARRQVHL